MAKITIIDDCVPFTKTIGFSYSGPEPLSISKKMWEDMKTFFQVSTSGVANTQLNWDDSGDPITYFERWWMKKAFSGFTRMQLKIKCLGSKKKTTDVGKFSVTMSSAIETTYESRLPGPIARLLWEIYSYLFYNRMRQRYLKQCTDLTVGYMEYVQKKFGLKTVVEDREYINAA